MSIFRIFFLKKKTKLTFLAAFGVASCRSCLGKMVPSLDFLDLFAGLPFLITSTALRSPATEGSLADPSPESEGFNGLSCDFRLFPFLNALLLSA